jgi:exonuclease SbcC
MRLLRVELCNFRQYGKQEVLFPLKGLVGILGKNGAGKSTFLNAIGYAFYGKIKGITNEMIKNQQSANAKDPCYVEIDFIMQDRLYKIHRNTISAKCFLSINGITKAVGTTSLNELVEKDLMKMDYKTFSTCYYAEQKDFNALVTLTEGKRVETITKLLQLESIDQAALKQRETYRELEFEVKRLEKLLETQTMLETRNKEMQEQMKETVKTLQSKEKQIILLQKEMMEQKDQVQAYEKTYEQYRLLKTQEEQWKHEMEVLKQNRLEPTKKRLDQLIAVEAKRVELEGLVKQFQELHLTKDAMAEKNIKFQQKKMLELELAQLKEELQVFVKEHQEKKKQFDLWQEIDTQVENHEAILIAHQQEMELAKEKLQENQHALKTKKAKYLEHNETKAIYEQMGEHSPCVTCKRPLAEHYGDNLNHVHQQMQESMNEAKILSAELKELESTVQIQKENLVVFQRTLQDARKLQTEKEKLSERISVLQDEFKKRKNHYQRVEKQKKDLDNVVFDEKSYQNVQQQLTSLSLKRDQAMQWLAALEEIPSLQDSYETCLSEQSGLSEKINKAMKDIVDLAFDEGIYQGKKQVLESLNERQTQEKESFRDLQMKAKMDQVDMDAIAEKLFENAKATKTIQNYKQDMVHAAVLDKQYKAYKRFILNKTAPRMSEIMSRYLEQITNGKYTQAEVDENYNIFLYRQGVKNPISFYSGGEADLAALCQRLAISEILASRSGQTGFELLAMDEVLSSFDEERQDQAIDMLRELNEYFPQILMISHGSHAKELFDYVLDIQLNEDQYSEAKWSTDWEMQETRDLLEEYQEKEQTA